MQVRGTVKPPVGIAFDSDFGNNIDSVLTLAFLRAAASKGLSRVIAVSIGKSNLKAAQAEEGLSNFYAATPLGGGRGVIAGFGGGGVGVNPVLVGLATNGKLANDTPIIDALVTKKTADGKTAYPSTIARPLDTAECGVSTRNSLLAQNDLNAIVLAVGPLTDTLELLELYGAKPQITAKVRYLVVAAGSFPNGGPSPAIQADIAAAKKVLAEWPTPIYFAGSEVGDALPYPGASITSDFSWTPSHPVVDAYKTFRPMPYDAPVPGMAAALYANHPDDGYFKLSEPGTVTVLDDGRTKFTPAAGGKHRYLIVDPAQKAKITAMYTELVSSKPVAPVAGGRGRGGRGASGAAFGASGGRGVVPALAPAAPPPVANVPPPQE
jgi:hypothetical protein